MGIYTVTTLSVCVNFNLNVTMLHKEFCDIAFRVRERFFSFSFRFYTIFHFMELML